MKVQRMAVNFKNSKVTHLPVQFCSICILPDNYLHYRSLAISETHNCFENKVHFDGTPFSERTLSTISLAVNVVTSGI